MNTGTLPSASEVGYGGRECFVLCRHSVHLLGVSPSADFLAFFSFPFSELCFGPRLAIIDLFFCLRCLVWVVFQAESRVSLYFHEQLCWHMTSRLTLWRYLFHEFMGEPRRNLPWDLTGLKKGRGRSTEANLQSLQEAACRPGFKIYIYFP